MNKKLKKVITDLTKLIESSLPEVEKEVNELIDYIDKEKTNYFVKKENQDKEYLKKFDNEIEHQLDYLMNPFYKKQFYKVLYFWEELNPESAKDYMKIYKEIWED